MQVRRGTGRRGGWPPVALWSNKAIKFSWARKEDVCKSADDAGGDWRLEGRLEGWASTVPRAEPLQDKAKQEQQSRNQLVSTWLGVLGFHLKMPTCCVPHCKSGYAKSLKEFKARGEKPPSMFMVRQVSSYRFVSQTTQSSCLTEHPTYKITKFGWVICQGTSFFHILLFTLQTILFNAWMAKTFLVHWRLTSKGTRNKSISKYTM